MLLQSWSSPISGTQQNNSVMLHATLEDVTPAPVLCAVFVLSIAVCVFLSDVMFFLRKDRPTFSHLPSRVTCAPHES